MITRAIERWSYDDSGDVDSWLIGSPEYWDICDLVQIHHIG